MSKRKPPKQRIVNLDQLRRALGVSEPTLRALIRDCPDLPVIAAGGQGRPWKFDLDEVLAWRLRTQGPAADAGGDLSPAQVKALWEARRIENQVRRESGDLIERSELMAHLSAVFGDLRKRLLQIPLLAAKERELSREDRLCMERLITEALNGTADRLQPQ